MDVISRSQAALLGMAFYYTGKPCSRGHYSERYVSSFVCVACGSDHSKAFYRENGAEELSKASYRKRKEQGLVNGGSEWVKKAQEITKRSAHNNNGRWNQEDDRMLRTLSEQGLNTADIAIAIGRTQNSINNRIARMPKPANKESAQ